MKAITVLSLVLLTTGILGCVSSLNPLYTEDDLVFDTDLLGNWSDGESQLSFTREAENAYTLITLEADERLGFKTHLVKLGNYTFLDIYPLDTLPTNYFYQATHFPVHTFIKIDIDKDQITVSDLNRELLSDLIKSTGEKISFVISQDNRMLLIASTKELQDLVKKYEELFNNPVVFRKEN